MDAEQFAARFSDDDTMQSTVNQVGAMLYTSRQNLSLDEFEKIVSPS